MGNAAQPNTIKQIVAVLAAASPSKEANLDKDTK